MRHYSKQREIVLEVLRSTNTHPTVHWIYEHCREKLPKISLGTVYRNLTELKNDGQIIEISVDDGFQHFDGNPKLHLHFHCKECGQIFDCVCPDNPLKDYIEKELGCLVSEQKLLFDGTCKACSEKI